MTFIENFLFPRLCYGCHSFGSYFCPKCTKKLQVGRLSHTRFKLIEAHLPIFADSHIKQAIIDLKYHFVTDVSSSLAQLSAKVIKSHFPLIYSYWHQNDFYLTAVPLHPHRQNWRGFNQSHLVAQGLATALHLKYLPDLVVKNRSLPPQAQLHSKSLRLTNQATSFSLSNPLNLPSHLIIFDDILTTGSTCLSVARLFPKTTSIWLLSLL